MQRECRNTPIDQRSLAYQRALARRVSVAANVFRTARAPLFEDERTGTRFYAAPTDAYTVAFLRVIDRGVLASVLAEFRRERRAIETGRRLPVNRWRPPVVQRQHADSPGHIYCFWDDRDAPNEFKIGRTERRTK